MAINFPQSLDTLTNPTGTELLENATAALDHAVQHSNANDGVEALQAKVGIDSSAVSTSHDYKLGDVATGDKAVSLTGTETLTNKTLTSPQIDFGSDAGGDLSIRSAGGVTERLGIGSTDQILTVAGGLPTWAANPAAASASTTVEGIVELATTAETTTGTDTTRAVTPDGLHDMTSLAGATWFLDEDTLATDSATKVASQQSIKAYVDTQKQTLIDSSVGTTDGSTYTTFPINLTGDGTTIQGWANSNFTAPTGGGSGNFVLTASGSNAELNDTLKGSGSQTFYRFNEGKKVRLKADIQFVTNVGIVGFGIADDAGRFDLIQTSITGSQARIVNNEGTLYAMTCASSTNSTTDINSGITDTSWNLYEFDFDPGASFVVRINGTEVANITTNVPSSGNAFFGFGMTNSSDSMRISGMTVSIER